MKKRNDTVRFSAEQLEAMRQRGESRTDWAKVVVKPATVPQPGTGVAPASVL